MTTQQPSRGAPPRANVGQSAQLADAGGHATAPGVRVWVAKVGFAAVAALVLAFIGAHADANAPAELPRISHMSDETPLPQSAAADAGPTVGLTHTAPRVPGGGTLPDGRIILNTAAEEDLKKLPGIGPARAKSILALRDRLGRFRSPQDLLRVKGIGRKTLARMLPMLVVNPPSAGADAGASS